MPLSLTMNERIQHSFIATRVDRSLTITSSGASTQNFDLSLSLSVVAKRVIMYSTTSTDDVNDSAISGCTTESFLCSK